jgi:hypothetical protein
MTLHDDLCTFVTIYRSVLLRMRNVSDTSSTKHLNTHFMCYNFSPRKSWPLLENVHKARYATGQAVDGNVTGHMRLACWITNSTDTYSEYETSIHCPTAKVVTRTWVSVAFVRKLPVLSSPQTPCYGPSCHRSIYVSYLTSFVWYCFLLNIWIL